MILQIDMDVFNNKTRRPTFITSLYDYPFQLQHASLLYTDHELVKHA